MKKTLTLLLSATIAVGGVALAPAGCASYPDATVVKCVRDTPKPKPTKAKMTKAQKKALKRLSIVWTTR